MGAKEVLTWFQFQKVRLKDHEDLGLNTALAQFQFQKVRLKAFLPLLDLTEYGCFNSKRFD